MLSPSIPGVICDVCDSRFHDDGVRLRFDKQFNWLNIDFKSKTKALEYIKKPIKRIGIEPNTKTVQVMVIASYNTIEAHRNVEFNSNGVLQFEQKAKIRTTETE